MVGQADVYVCSSESLVRKLHLLTLVNLLSILAVTNLLFQLLDSGLSSLCMLLIAPKAAIEPSCSQAALSITWFELELTEFE